MPNTFDYELEGIKLQTSFSNNVTSLTADSQQKRSYDIMTINYIKL